MFLCRVPVGTHPVVTYNHRTAPSACTVLFISHPFGVIYRSLLNRIVCVRMEKDDMGLCGINEETCMCCGYEDVLLEASLFIFANETMARSGALGSSVSESCLTYWVLDKICIGISCVAIAYGMLESSSQSILVFYRPIRVYRRLL